MKPLPEYLQDIFDFYTFAIAFTIRRHRDVPERSYGDILENETLFRWLFRTTKMDLFETPPVMTPFLKAADYFLEHGKLKYRPRASCCSFANVRQHIRERRGSNG